MRTTCFALCLVLLFILTVRYVGAQEGETSGSDVEIVRQLTEPSRYDKWRRPNPRNKTQVFVHMHVYSVGSVDAQNLRYTTQVLLRYRWRDERLLPRQYIQQEGAIDRIWSPHLYIVNELDSKVMGSSRKDVMVSIQPDGTVVHLARLKVTLQCVMDLKKFPFDVQCCPFVLESWSYNYSQLELSWEHEWPVTIDSQLQMPEYWLAGLYVNNSITHYQGKGSSTINQHLNIYYGKAAGNFSSIVVNFELQREFGFYLMDYYMPSVLIVAVSWVTFWLDPSSTPGRTTLGTSTLLTFITLSRNIGNSLPKVSYIKSTEIWFIGCTVFIFSSLVEFTFVNIIWRRKKDVSLTKMTGTHILQSTLTPQVYRRREHLTRSSSFNSLSSIDDPKQNGISELRFRSRFKPSLDYVSKHPQPEPLPATTLTIPARTEGANVFTMTPQEIANWIDRRSRVAFPIAFFAFNCVYWTWTLFLL